MSRDELVQRYLDGQMGRRVFIRRLIATGVATATALTYADILQAMPAGATVTDFYVLVQDYAFTPKVVSPRLGTNVDYEFDSANTHNHSATDKTNMHLFDTNFVVPGGASVVAFSVAGTYPYHCKETNHIPMTGQVRVAVKVDPDSAKLGKKFTITWATSIPAGFVVDVQRRSGNGAFSDWKHGVTTTSGTYKPNHKGTFAFRARLRKKSNGAHSDWSPPRAITVT
jgi:plastocyanin